MRIAGVYAAGDRQFALSGGVRYVTPETAFLGWAPPLDPGESSGHLIGRRARHSPATVRGVDMHGASMRWLLVADDYDAPSFDGHWCGKGGPTPWCLAQPEEVGIRAAQGAGISSDGEAGGA
eukprot:COSAG01_NODE_4692_length_4808_cov_9.520493_9_plen_122_part_00